MISPHLYGHLCSKTVTSFSEVLNLLTFAKSFNDSSSASQYYHFVDVSIDFLQRFLCEEEDNCDVDETVHSLIRFVVEQLQLCQKNAKARQ